MNTAYEHVLNTDRQLHLAKHWMPWHRWIHIAIWDLDLCNFQKEKLGIKG